jgi:adenosine kinase
VRSLVDGATYLFTNEYEKALCEQKTGWSDEEVLDRVGTRVTTLGPKGVTIDRKGEPSVRVGAVTDVREVEPTGVGDAFRAGFLSALSWELPLERAAQMGNLLAAHALEVAGPQEYSLHREQFVERFADAYGQEAADEVAGHLLA